MPEQLIRFCVPDGKGLRAATWRCWTPAGKEDVYLACRELKGAMKASLHQSGSWHLAYDPGFFETSMRQEDRTNKGRFIDKWQTPAHLAPGVLLAFRIVTPCGAVFTSQPETSGIFSAPKPAEGRAIEFDLFLVEPMIVLSGWPGKERMKTEFALGTKGWWRLRPTWTSRRSLAQRSGFYAFILSDVEPPDRSAPQRRIPSCSGNRITFRLSFLPIRGRIS